MRLDQLSENQLVATITGLQRELEELKSRQRASGRSGVLSYTAQQAGAFDLRQTVTDTIVLLAVTFSAGSDAYPIASPYLDLTVDGLRLDGANGEAINGSNFALLQRPFLEFDKSTLPSASVLRWFVEFSVNGTMTYTAKAFARASCAGTVAVERVT